MLLVVFVRCSRFFIRAWTGWPQIKKWRVASEKEMGFMLCLLKRFGRDVSRMLNATLAIEIG